MQHTESISDSQLISLCSLCPSTCVLTQQVVYLNPSSHIDLPLNSD